MRLDRNVNPDGKGKYALIKLRKCNPIANDPSGGTLCFPAEAVDFGDTPDSEFFVIRLKDKYAPAALAAYACAACADDREFGFEVLQLAFRAAMHPNRLAPDTLTAGPESAIKLSL